MKYARVSTARASVWRAEGEVSMNDGPQGDLFNRHKVRETPIPSAKRGITLVSQLRQLARRFWRARVGSTPSKG